MCSRRVMVLCGPATAAPRERIEALLEPLAAQAEIVAVSDTADATPIAPGIADAAVVFGGDGTFLGAARRLMRSGIPVVGVNTGRMGFLTEFSQADFLRHLPAILAGHFPTLPRMMLEVTVRHQGEVCFASPAMNEVSILAGAPFRMIELSVRHNAVDVFTCRGDGLVLATPTGSTGYTLSAGGPILMPGMHAIAMTAVSVHSLAVRPVVLDAMHAVEVRVRRANPGTAASIDGQLQCPLTPDHVVEVVAGDHSLPVVQNPDWPFFRTLTAKLQWGHSPHHCPDPPAEQERLAGE